MSAAKLVAFMWLCGFFLGREHCVRDDVLAMMQFLQSCEKKSWNSCPYLVEHTVHFSKELLEEGLGAFVAGWWPDSKGKHPRSSSSPQLHRDTSKKSLNSGLRSRGLLDTYLSVTKFLDFLSQICMELLFNAKNMVMNIRKLYLGRMFGPPIHPHTSLWVYFLDPTFSSVKLHFRS